MSVLPQHLDDLHKSGLSPEQIVRCEFRSTSDPREISAILNWSRPAGAIAPCLVIPYFDADGKPMTYLNGDGRDHEFVRLKPDKPRLDKGKEKKAIKYESPKGSPNRAYFPPGTRSALRGVGIPLLITEGEKKAACADQYGFPCIGLGGVWNWQAKSEEDAHGNRVGPRELIPDLLSVQWTGRKVFIVFDSDTAEKIQIQWAEWHLSEVLRKAGADVHVVRLPSKSDGAKVGLDDYLVSHSADELRKLIAAATVPKIPVDLTGPNDASDNPHALAAGFLESISTGEKPYRLRFWRAEFNYYSSGAYSPVPDADLRARLTEWLRSMFVRLNEHGVASWRNSDSAGLPPKVKPVTGEVVSNVMLALRGLCLLSSTIESPAWIDGAKGPRPENLLSLKNGLLDLAGDELLPANKSFFTSTAAPFEYNPSAPRPKLWLKFLLDLWPDDPQSIETLQDWFGYLLTPDTRQQKILFLLGPRRSGKGTIARVLRELVGVNNVANPTLGSLATNFGLSPLVGKSVAVVSDARLSGRSDTAVIAERLLSISGEDAQTIDRKHRDAVTTKLTTRFVILSNELPRLMDSAGALPGRLVMIEMTKTFYGMEDYQLFERLRPELPGIFLWAIEGWKRLNARGRFIQPESANEIAAEMEDLASPVGAFVRERCITGSSFEVEVNDIFAGWKSWCESHGKKEPGTIETFGRDLRAVVPGLRKRRPRTEFGRTHVYIGIKFKSNSDTEDPVAAVTPGHSVPVLHAMNRKEKQEEKREETESAMGGRGDQYDHCDHSKPDECTYEVENDDRPFDMRGDL